MTIWRQNALVDSAKALRQEPISETWLKLSACNRLVLIDKPHSQS